MRGLWSGAFTLADFAEQMEATIHRGLTAAWYAGAAECGITPEDLSEEEREELAYRIELENGFVEDFGLAIREADKAAGGLLRPLMSRAELWVNRWDAIETRAKAMACGNQKARWELGPTEHCRDCAHMAGRVYRYSTWEKYGILPRSPLLECGGFRCQCELVDTDEPATRGRPPQLVGYGKRIG